MATNRTTYARRATQPSTTDIARLITPRQILRRLGVRIRNSKRADCPFCKGNSKGTIAFTERLWRCHRCNQGGDVFTLVRLANRCDFPTALRFLAELAGIRLEDCRSPNALRELAATQRRREGLRDGANKLSALEHALLRESRGLIHDAERQRLKVSERLAALTLGEPERFRREQDCLWVALQAAEAILSRELSAYSLLSFGTPEDRSRFVLHPELRDEIIARVRWMGYVRSADGKQVEVLA